jgi:hypothetical protein
MLVELAGSRLEPAGFGQSTQEQLQLVLGSLLRLHCMHIRLRGRFVHTQSTVLKRNSPEGLASRQQGVRGAFFSFSEALSNHSAKSGSEMSLPEYVNDTEHLWIAINVLQESNQPFANPEAKLADSVLIIPN